MAIEVLSLFASVEMLTEAVRLQTAIDEVGFPRWATAVLDIVTASVPAMLLTLTTAADFGSHTTPVFAAESAE